MNIFCIILILYYIKYLPALPPNKVSEEYGDESMHNIGDPYYI